jgi:hypothetical protein
VLVVAILLMAEIHLLVPYWLMAAAPEVIQIIMVQMEVQGEAQAEV